jgi:taurine dioxygenase
MLETRSRRGQGPRYRHPAQPATAYRTLRARRLTPILGAEIEGIDLTAPIGADQAAELARAFADHQVLFFRDQPMSAERHLAFGRLFGGLHVHPAAPHAPGHPERMIIHADADSPRANGEVWHSDVSCEPEPPLGSILAIHTCPPEGGDTLFASMTAAYEALSGRMKRYLDALTAIHDGEHVYRGTYANLGVQDKPSYPRAEHPVVRRHPVTGKPALYVNRGFTRRLVGVPADESEAILRYLYEHMENPLFQCRFRWQRDSVAFWDNRCVQHRALWDYWPQTRSGFRVTVAGDRPQAWRLPADQSITA